jgi:hypothetical protein
MGNGKRPQSPNPQALSQEIPGSGLEHRSQIGAPAEEDSSESGDDTQYN